MIANYSGRRNDPSFGARFPDPHIEAVDGGISSLFVRSAGRAFAVPEHPSVDVT
jgi:hypothetical protein